MHGSEDGTVEPRERGGAVAATRARRIPRLASDFGRQWLSAGVATAVTTVVFTVYGFLVGFGVLPLSAIELIVGPAGVIVSFGIAWFIASVTYALATALVYRRLRGDELRRVALATDARHGRRRLALILSLGDEISSPVVAVVIALAGVVYLVVQPSFSSSGALIVPAVLGLVGTWLTMVVSFAMAYLRAWARSGALRFPDEEEPTSEHARDAVRDERRYSDFFYVAVQFATTFAGSDVALTRARARNLATLNSIVAFLLNTVALGVFLSFAVSATSA